MDNQTQSGLVGGWRMKSVIFQHPLVVSLLKWGGRGWGVGYGWVSWEGHSARNETSTGLSCSIHHVEHMERSERG